MVSVVLRPPVVTWQGPIPGRSIPAIEPTYTVRLMPSGQILATRLTAVQVLASLGHIRREAGESAEIILEEPNVAWARTIDAAELAATLLGTAGALSIDPSRVAPGDLLLSDVDLRGEKGAL